jgi:hypothetical protein
LLIAAGFAIIAVNDDRWDMAGSLSVRNLDDDLDRVPPPPGGAARPFGCG